MAEIERLGDPVIARAVQRDSSREQSFQGGGQRSSRGVKDRQMVETGAAARRRRTATALPGIEADMVVIAAGRNEGCLAATALGQRESEHAAVEGQRPVEIRDLEVDVAYPDGSIDRMRRARLLQREKRGGLVRHVDLLRYRRSSW